jgi:hypothetical protein
MPFLRRVFRVGFDSIMSLPVPLLVLTSCSLALLLRQRCSRKARLLRKIRMAPGAVPLLGHVKLFVVRTQHL